MTDLKTTAGLSFRNPIVISSSGLTNKSAGANKNGRRWCRCNCSEITVWGTDHAGQQTNWKRSAFYPEASDYSRKNISVSTTISEYLTFNKKKARRYVPFLSLPASPLHWFEWIDSQRWLKAGADALEINILALQSEAQYTYGLFEQRHTDISSATSKMVKIPVIMKLGDNLTNPVALITSCTTVQQQLFLFNRFYQPDINIERGRYFRRSIQQCFPTRQFAPLIGIASAVVDKIDYAASGGVANAESVVKAILAGASGCRSLRCSLSEYAFIGEANRFLSLHGWNVIQEYSSIQRQTEY